MKILLDHNLDWRLSHSIHGHEVTTTLKMGWDTLKNGALLSEAEKSGFAGMLTADKGIKSQQRMGGRLITVVTARSHQVMFGLITDKPSSWATVQSLSSAQTK